MTDDFIDRLDPALRSILGDIPALDLSDTRRARGARCQERLASGAASATSQSRNAERPAVTSVDRG